MAADKRSEKVAHTFYPFGFYHKHTDAGWRDIAKKEMQPQQSPGLADAYLLPIRPYWEGRIFIEAKNGEGAHKERFPFANWNERQRLFCVACAYSHIPYWMFLMMGSTPAATDYPLQAYLIPGEQLFELEWLAGSRKSLSYVTALTLLEPLTWVPGQDRWEIPETHPFQTVLRGNRHAHPHHHLGAADNRGQAGGASTPPQTAAAHDPPLVNDAPQLHLAFEAAAAFYPG